MNSKKIFSIIIITFSITYLYSQNFDSKLSEAKSAYKSGKLEDARFALQQALNEVDMMIGKEILALLPAKLNSLSSINQTDNINGSSSGFSGVFVNREYSNGEGLPKNTIGIITNSPLMAGINAILSMPAILTASNPNQKTIKVDGYKSLMQKNDNGDGIINWDVQVPFGSALMTVHCENCKTESDVIAMVNTIPVGKIAALTK